eukprot:XP_001701390.1 predicted protein [Chlamydomonas reinhardtii]
MSDKSCGPGLSRQAPTETPPPPPPACVCRWGRMPPAPWHSAVSQSVNRVVRACCSRKNGASEISRVAAGIIIFCVPVTTCIAVVLSIDAQPTCQVDPAPLVAGG